LNCSQDKIDRVLNDFSWKTVTLHEKSMLSPEQFFSQMLQLEAPFTMNRVETVMSGSAIQEVILHVSVPADYHLDGYDYLHSKHRRRWQHLHLFQYPCFIECDVPVYQRKSDGRTMQLPVPWSRSNTGFTLLFESHVLALIQMTASIAVVARHLEVYPQRIQTIFDAYTEIAYQECCRNGIEAPKHLGCDETNTHKGHEYITVVADMETGAILALEDGKSSESLLAVQKRMDAPERVEAVSLDMSPAFIKASREGFPSAVMTFDRFHVVRLVNRAFRDLHRPKNAPHDLLRFWQDRFSFLYEQTTIAHAAAFLAYWCDSLEEAKLNADSLIRSLRAHADGIVSFVATRLTNALLEGINSKIQFIKRAARGYRFTKNFKRMILFVFGVLKPNIYAFPTKII
jgi:transposase